LRATPFTGNEAFAFIKSFSPDLLHIADPTAAETKQAGHSTVGLLGTRFTMEHAFYRERLSERHGLQVIVPNAEGRDTIHRIIYQKARKAPSFRGGWIAGFGSIMSIMVRLQAFRYALMPTGTQQRQMRRFAGSCRFVYNRALALQKQRYEQGETKLSYAGLCGVLTEWKRHQDSRWLTESPSQALQQSLKDLERAYHNFFEKRADFPRFKKKGQRDSFRFPQGFRLDSINSRLFLPKLGWVRYRNSREVLGTVKNVTVSHVAGRWFVSLQTEQEAGEPRHSATSMVGIDMGIVRFATLSTGQVIAPLNAFRKHQIRLARYQRAMSRKVKFSHNWRKAKTRVQRIQTRIGNARRDFLHKASTQISQNHVIVCLEDLQVQNMSRSAAGTRDTPGKNVRAKSGLNRAILDQGWAEFRRQLEYKQAWRGGDVIAVPPRNTSRTCPACGHVSAENRQTQARFCCVVCGYENHADLVGAINVLAAGHAVLACGGTGLSARPMKQEPTEATQAHAA